MKNPQRFRGSWTQGAALAASLALCLTGCGSTSLRNGAAGGSNSLQGGTGTSGGGLDGGSNQGGGAATGSATGTPLGSGTTSTGGSLSGGSSGSSGSSGSGVGSGSGSFNSGTSGSGGTVNKKPLRIGVFGFDVTAIYAAFGKQGEAPKDAYTTFRAMASYINKHGGIGGRQIVLQTHTADSSGTDASEGQKACQDFTQDNKVDIVYDVGGSPTLAACLQRAGVASFSGNNYATDGVDTGTHPNWLQPASMRADRLYHALVAVSLARGKLKRGDTLGVMVDDCPYGHRTYDNVITPLAQQAGVKLVSSTLRCVQNLVADLGPLTNDIQQAELKFASSGVTHVIALHGAEAFVISNFTTQASQQKYHPKYLVTTNAYAWQNSQSDATVKISSDAVPNISGVGFLPYLDVGPNATFSAQQKALQAVCTKADPDQYNAQADKGKNHYWFAVSLFYSQCSSFFLMKTTIEATGMALGWKDLRGGYSSLKSKGELSPALTNGRLGGPSDSTDGAGFVQAFDYDPQKTFKYVGSPFALTY